MGRVLSLSIAAGLALTAGAVMAQSRTVSTADMPKPGVSYISGPTAPVRKETVTTGTLPQPARLYVGGQVSVGGGYQGRADDGYGGSVAEGGYYYGDGWNDRDRRDGRDRDHGRPGHDHDHDGHDGHGGGHDHDGGRGESLSLAAGSAGNTSASGAGVKLAPQRQPDRRDRHRGWDRGYDGTPPVPPGTGFTNSRAPQPGTGMGSGNQPGTGIPTRSGDGGWRGHGR
ncbi:hypothetical protein [Luteibacter yeojuensis]|uniref:Translation initiation factor IF-2 n=1 Tax=Luteibacter yeojuensis TaxID=345309 RepID=A0A7X5QV56_9GAMM|nr:hypothetical protein [Luteibacter yeojuensis]NID16000.1 hypothetical protein [Luteibacter yeojuensis]